MVKSPCIDICTIDYKAGVCTGCNRTLEEITNWSSFNDIQKKKVLMKVKKKTTSKQNVPPANRDD
jgi:predicted Fe-S protein YdhL (DUF1289 family)